jgi:hypothetical protein
MEVHHFHGPSLAAMAVVITGIYLGWTLIYRLYISPLSKIPGPKLAAATFWYEFYYDAILGGRYTFKIRELHQRYGESIRCTTMVSRPCHDCPDHNAQRR